MTQAEAPHPVPPPKPGQLVHIRSRRYLVEDVVGTDLLNRSPIVTLACADDDAQGQPLQVYWNYEPDRVVMEEENWAGLAEDGFDQPRVFAAFLHTLRWNCVTATDPGLFQSPFRAGIKIDAYQMEPLRKALRLPRVTLFIADDTGLGKTIEAGLIARELLLRKKCKTIVVAAPPSVLPQWKAELEERFGLTFEILDRDYITRVRRDRGFGVNPWTTHSRFLVSHNLLGDPAYADNLNDWLGNKGPKTGSLFILDEAHHAAPSSGGRYGIESRFTKAIRRIAPRFEHRVFLSATPHNGHSNSFSTLMELLDPYRFTRGVPVLKAALDEVMVRRLKEDIRALQGGFPVRHIERIVINDLPEDAPELQLSRLLEQYRELRSQRFAGRSKRARAASGLLTVGLQQRLLSSIEAFARTLKVHRETVEREWGRIDAVAAKEQEEQERNLVACGGTTVGFTGDPADATRAAAPLLNPLDDDDPLSREPDDALPSPETLDADEAAEEQAALAELASQAETPDDGGRFPPASTLDEQAAARSQREQEVALLKEMQDLADAHRHNPDAKVRALLGWIKDNLCPDLPAYGRGAKGDAPRWNDRRLIIFTENRQGTKRYLKQILDTALAGTHLGDQRLEVIDGLTPRERRQDIQRRFNTDPQREPLRILLATDAAREGLNFQAHCTDLFHFDLPWNPGRIEQRNGRIDRKLQPADEVRCHYFVLPQRAEDRVLEVLVAKTERIKRELGSLSKVIEDDLERRLKKDGIRHAAAADLAAEIDGSSLDPDRQRTVDEELGAAQDRQAKLESQIATCERLLETSSKSVGFAPEPFREALSVSLELLGKPGLEAATDEDGRRVWTSPGLSRLAKTDASWAASLDSLRTPRPPKTKLGQWRKDAPIRPVVFKDAGVITQDTVHLHLDQRVVQRLLSRFRAQGYTDSALSRACLLRAPGNQPRVALLGRLCLYGQNAERLHEELIPVTARWSALAARSAPLEAFATRGEETTLALLDKALAAPEHPFDDALRTQLLTSAAQDVKDLLPQLEAKAAEAGASATQLLSARGEKEAADLTATLLNQRKRVEAEIAKAKKQTQQAFAFTAEEKRQRTADQAAWSRRLEEFEAQLEDEPPRVQAFYEVKTPRVEPVGLIYLWPQDA